MELADSTEKFRAPSERYAIVDILRAYALLGVVIINYTSFHDWDYSHGSTFDLVLGYIAEYVFFRKSALLLSVLFGFGFTVLISHLQGKGINKISFFTKRMFWLFVIAFINSCFFEGDILKSYSLLGLILLVFYRTTTNFILAVAIILLVLIPFSSGYTLFGIPSNGQTDNYKLFLSHYLPDVIKYNLINSYAGQVRFKFYSISVQHIMLCCFLWGMWIQRIHFVENLQTHKKIIRRLFWFSIPAFALSSYLTYLGKFVTFLKVYYNFFIITFLCAMVFFASAILWVYVSGKLKFIFKLMSLYGKMTLTNYITQNIIGLFVFSGIGFSIGKSKGYSFYFILSIAVFVLQLFLCRYWLRQFNYGPVEWIWRKLSSKTTIPFRRFRLNSQL